MLGITINQGTDMAIKATKATRKKSSRKVRDLTSRKDPKGGAQKKEGPGLNMNTRGGTPSRAGKTRLS
ncbi:MAG: hypothetical protein H0T83_08445 [Chthoniobacterales bacterium]|nr:hypothetical protein [Chthoniobacterales bacterium]